MVLPYCIASLQLYDVNWRNGYEMVIIAIKSLMVKRWGYNQMKKSKKKTKKNIPLMFQILAAMHSIQKKFKTLNAGI